MSRCVSTVRYRPTQYCIKNAHMASVGEGFAQDSA